MFRALFGILKAVIIASDGGTQVRMPARSYESGLVSPRGV